MGPTFFPPRGIFNPLRARGIFNLLRDRSTGLPVLLCGLLLAAGLAAPPPGGRAQAADGGGSVRLRQSISIGIGHFTGSRQAFLRHEDGNIPSLNPEIQLTGDVQLQLRLPSSFRVDLHAKTGEGEGTTFGLGYRNWDLSIGPRQMSFANAGLAFSRRTTGASLRYEPEGGQPGLEAVLARTSSRAADVVFSGDDSFGPFFLGQKNIVEESEQIFIDGQLQRRGAGPGEQDYYIDYRGGFLFFNKVVLAHQQVRAVYQYEVDDPKLSSEFVALQGGYDFSLADGGAEMRVRSFALQDHLPIDDKTILQQSGYTLTAYGARLETTFASGARLSSAVITTDLEQFRSVTEDAADTLVIVADETDYKLSRKPVLYESERIVMRGPDGRGPEELERNLDYVVDYYDGVVTFAFEPTPGAKMDVEYKYIRQVGVVPTRRQGYETRQRFDYRSERWRTTSWLELATDDYVSVGSHRSPDTKLNAGAANEFVLTDAWSLLADVTVLERTDGVFYRPALGASYARESLSAEGRLAARLGEAGGHMVHDYTLEGDVRWRSFADFRLEFEKELGADDGWLPDKAKATAVGLAGRLPYVFTYTRGEKHYNEQLEARLTVPAEGRNVRGAVTVSSRWMYADTFADTPRLVHSLFGDVGYNGPQGGYVRARTTWAVARLGGTSTNSYSLQVDAGRSLGARALVDYQLRHSAQRTDVHAAAVDTRDSLGHVLTVAGNFSDAVGGALVYRWNDQTRDRVDRGPTASAERGWQASLNARWGDVETSLAYDHTTTEIVSTTPTTTDVRRWRLTSEWSRPRLSLRAAAEWAVFDGLRRRSAVELVPSWRLSEHADLWVGYEFISSTNRSDPDAAYSLHELRLGVTFRM